MTAFDAYSMFNMGAGMVVFVAGANAEAAVGAARECSIEGFCAGVVGESPRQPVFEPVGEVLMASEYPVPSALRDSPAS